MGIGVNYLFAGQIIHADDPARFSQHWKSLRCATSSAEILSGNVRIAPDIYVVFSPDVKYTGIINLADKEYTIPLKTLLDTVFLQAFGESPDSPNPTASNVNFKLVAGKGTIRDTTDAADWKLLTVPPHSIYIQEAQVFQTAPWFSTVPAWPQRN